MSAVEDVTARIAQLQQTLDAKWMELQVLQTQQRYNSSTGVDEHIATGKSVATLEVKIVAGRNMLYNAGFLSGKKTYVCVRLHLMDAQQSLIEKRMTTKKPIHYSPCWQELLIFQSVPTMAASFNIDVMQEERIGADLVIGSVMIPLEKIQDQRPQERWHVLSKDDHVSICELLVGCRFERSPIVALERDLQLLQNQMNELHNYLERQQQLPHQILAAQRYVPPNPLQGKEVVVSPAEFKHAGSTRFSAVASFPARNMRKRDHLSNVIEEHNEQPGLKRQRVTEGNVRSLTDRLANWLLPSTPGQQPPPPPPPTDDGNESIRSSTFFPFQQTNSTQSKRPSRRAGRQTSRVQQRQPTKLQLVQQWLFTNRKDVPSTNASSDQAAPFY